MARQCWGRLYVEWTGRMRPHCLAEAGPRTSPLEGRWLRQTGAETKGRPSGSSPPRPGPGDPLLHLQELRTYGQGGQVSGGPRWHCCAGWRETASRRRRAHFPRRGPDPLDPRGAGSALQDEETERDVRRTSRMQSERRVRADTGE